MSSILEVYSGLATECLSITTKSVEGDSVPSILASHNSIEDYISWASVLSGRPEEIMINDAIREYELSILANVTGLYNLSFTGLRFFFERTLTAILFSTKEIDLRLWMKGARDTYWKEICDDEKGIFSHNFCNAFFPELKDDAKHFGVLAKKVYRECSEYVHGNVSTQGRVPRTLSYKKDLVDEWHAKADTIKSIIIFSYCLRYLPHLDSTSKSKVEANVLESFSHNEIIRSYFAQPH